MSKGKNPFETIDVSAMQSEFNDADVAWIRGLLDMHKLRKGNALHSHQCGKWDFVFIYRSKRLEVRCCKECRNKFYLTVYSTYSTKRIHTVAIPVSLIDVRQYLDLERRLFE